MSPEASQFDYEQLSQHGYCEITGFDSAAESNEISRKIGSPFEPPDMPMTQTLTPRTTESTTRNTYSGNYGLNAFPLHTDLAHWFTPPRYFILRCIEPDTTVSTILVHKNKILEGLPKSTIKRALFKPRRKNTNKQYLLRLVHNGIFRWDEIFIQPENTEAEEAAKHIKAASSSIERHSFTFTKKGQVLIIDNWNILHGRTEVTSAESKRKLERTYLTELYT